MCSIPKPASEPPRSISEIKREIVSLTDQSANPQPEIRLLSFLGAQIESNSLVSTAILGNADSEVAALIETLGNSDWVKQGLSYTKNSKGEHQNQCPFCQQNTISAALSESLHDYFDATYKKQIDDLETLIAEYTEAVNNFPSTVSLVEHAIAKQHEQEIYKSHRILIDICENNISTLEKKRDNPKSPYELQQSKEALSELNSVLKRVNKDIVRT